MTYSFKNKYLLKLGLRYDGSSRFGKNAQYGTFPSFSAGWILSEEDFLADNGVINFLKFRASWGQVGNAEIGNFASRGLFGGVSYNQRPGLLQFRPKMPSFHGKVQRKQIFRYNLEFWKTKFQEK